MSTAASFASVKLPAALVEKARDAARPMRRSVASQIEYWATLGRIVEHTGLTAGEAQSAIAGYEEVDGVAARSAPVPAPLSLDAIEARFARAGAGGSLAARVRDTVLANRALVKNSAGR